MQVKAPNPSVVQMENDVFGDLNKVYSKNLAAARAARGDGTDWFVPSSRLAAHRAIRPEPTSDAQVKFLVCTAPHMTRADSLMVV